ncbi:hypothetical protein CNMCM5623_004400 [Aspergillus felis]|uniref:Prion-inhibition and propagation HeLo domain-containing protein n=1 Tax=Aspergillus felis TaxID=1287682 RepID=A0A8H6QHR0_9EURO|nr:hypothetical protein CNMCM5623_004400 [Aspergillus felis]
MDPAGGLVLGAVSLVTLFKSCLDLYDAIESGRNLGTDYKILVTKVGVERVRLALWGSLVGLYDLPKDENSQGDGIAEYYDVLDSRLADPRIASAVADILNCMRRLFEDSGSLVRKYGLQELASDDLAVLTIENPVKMTFKKTYARLQASASRIQKQTPLVAAARWAIKDKKKFERFVNDLRDFNDSLTLLFPDVEENTRTTMIAEIKESTDLDSLQLVENAVSDLAGGEELVEAASSRITEISKYSTSVAETAATEITNDSIADVNVERISRQLEKMEVTMSKRVELRGSLQFQLSSLGGQIFLRYDFFGIPYDDYVVEIQKEMEYVNPPYQAWSLMYMSNRERTLQLDFSQQDVESDRKSHGRYPGTYTMDGYIAEFNMWLRNSNATPQQFSNTNGLLPGTPLDVLVERVRRIRLQGGQSWNFDSRSPGKDLSELLGPPRGSGIHGEVTDILNNLNRRRVFPDVEDGASLIQIALTANGGIPNFVLQVILAHELRRRMVHLPGVVFGNVSRRIVAACQASERWIDGMDLRYPDPKGRPAYFELHSLVHERQVEGLVRFAETMAWPALGEMRRFTEEVYSDIRSGGSTNRFLYDWLFGLMLPGKKFVNTVMASLVAATPSLAHLGDARYYISGLVVGDRSYWPAKSVLGRVLGAMKETRAANGWVGPFPRPVGLQAEDIADGWSQVHARDVTFNGHLLPEDQSGDSGRFPMFRHRDEESNASSWLRGLADRSKWVVPVGPSKSLDKVDFRAIKLKTIEENSNEEETEPRQRAALELLINDQSVEFTLYSNPVFVTAPKCIDGPHAAHQDDLPKMQNILSESVSWLHERGALRMDNMQFWREAMGLALHVRSGLLVKVLSPLDV